MNIKYFEEYMVSYNKYNFLFFGDNF